jgi:hypothetical protein
MVKCLIEDSIILSETALIVLPPPPPPPQPLLTSLHGLIGDVWEW